MNADKLIQMVLKINPHTFGRISFLDQAHSLNRYLDNWQHMVKKSPRQSQLWQKRYWELVNITAHALAEYFLRHDGRPGKLDTDGVKKLMKLFKRLYEFDEERLHKIMIVHPLAFTFIEEEWAAWTKLAI